MKNPLDTIRDETTLLGLFQSIMSESAYKDTIVKNIFEQQNEIKQMIYRKNESLFSWDEVPGNDSRRLIKFLKQEFGIRRVKTAKIIKTDNGRNIRVTIIKKYLSLGLNNEKTKVNLKIDDGRSAEFIAKSENGKLNIYKKDIYVYLILSDLNNLLKELNEKIKSKNLICSIENESTYKELSKTVEILKLEPAFICRGCKPLKIFDSEDEIRTHREESGHRFISWMPPRDKRLIIIKNYSTCVSVPMFELFEKSGALVEINNRIKSINLKCHIVKETGEKFNLIDFEPAFMCRQCSNIIFDSEEELKEHAKKHETERKKYLGEISKPSEKREQEHEKYLKSRDRTR